MGTTDILKGKRILIVDDEPDILETLEELLDSCTIDSADSFETAQKFLNKNTYAAAILDIMGVDGYKLLEIANAKGFPALMFTAHALSPDNLVKSIKSGAHSYIPKDKITDIAQFLAEVIDAHEKGQKKNARWYQQLKPYFDKKFKAGWREQDKEFWEEFERNYPPTKDELAQML